MNIVRNGHIVLAILGTTISLWMSTPAHAKNQTQAQKDPVTLYFPFDSAVMKQRFIFKLQLTIREMKRNSLLTATINGHTDRAGSEDYNLRLSTRRAQYVAGLIEQAGITPSRISYFAFGESDPALPTADGLAEAKNRRVEIYLE
jgi:OOP family OmpA-OmpF porin